MNFDKFKQNFNFTKNSSANDEKKLFAKIKRFISNTNKNIN